MPRIRASSESWGLRRESSVIDFIPSTRPGASLDGPGLIVPGLPAKHNRPRRQGLKRITQDPGPTLDQRTSAWWASGRFLIKSQRAGKSRSVRTFPGKPPLPWQPR